MILSLTRKTSTRCTVEIFNDSGEIQCQKVVDRYSERDATWLKDLVSWDLSETVERINDVCLDDTDTPALPVTFDVHPSKKAIAAFQSAAKRADPAPLEPTPFTIYCREINQPKATGESVSDSDPGDCLRQTFASCATAVEPLLEWTDSSRLCCLDVDYHELPYKKRPLLAELENTISQLQPQPYAWHPSHGRGAKLYYVGQPGFPANELAAVSAFHWYDIDPRATFDLITSTRHPCYARSRDKLKPPLNDPDDITYYAGSSDLSSVRRLLLGELDTAAVEEYLAGRGWSMGQSLPHSECPIDPSPDFKLSVYVGDMGIFCHKCAARGYGSPARPGFYSYATMVRPTDSRVMLMVKNFTHYEHAKTVLLNRYPDMSDRTIELVYRVLLKLVHTPDDPRIPLVFTAGKGFVRMRGQWVTADGEAVVVKGLKEFAASLPSTLIPADKGFGRNMAKYTSLLNAGDIEEHGYPAISFLRGAKIYSQFLPLPEDEVCKFVLRKEFRETPPTYLSQSKRMPSKDMWSYIDGEFPGIDRNYLQLLIAAKGSSEGRLSQCPFLLITGPSGSGKSTTVHIAAGICGDKAEEPIWHPHPERFRASLMDAARNSGFVCVNEVFKSATAMRISQVQSLNPMLSLTEDSRSHVLYVGSVPFGRLPVFICTDVGIPSEVEADIQLARRFVCYRLGNRIYWEDTFTTRGIRPHEFRLISAEHNLAADSLLSMVIDQFFRERTSLAVIAKTLQAGDMDTFSDGTEFKREAMARLYQAVISAPPLTGTDEKRYHPAARWKRIDRSHRTGELSEIWREVCDGEDAEQWGTSRACDAEDWSHIIQVPFPVVCEYRASNRAVFIRFRSTDSAKRPAWINGQKSDLTYE